MVDKKPRPEKEQALNCPRCKSTNTKFCYYNNYSLSQPRYFCKTCRRYWTEGGSLRNVPVGGGSRKNNKRSSSSSTSSNPNSNSAAASKKIILPDLTTPPRFPAQNPKIHQGHDLNLAYNPTNFNDHFYTYDPKNLNPSFLGLGSFMSTIPVSDSTNSVVFSSGFPMGHDDHQFKPSLGFALDGLENNLQGVSADHQDHHNHQSRNMLFPFDEQLKNTSTATDEFDHHHQQQQDKANGYWSGMLAGGSW